MIHQIFSRVRSQRRLVAFHLPKLLCHHLALELGLLQHLLRTLESVLKLRRVKRATLLIELESVLELRGISHIIPWLMQEGTGQL